MTIKWTDQGWEDYQYWNSTDQSKVEKIKQLLKAIKEDPFAGIGKPEPLKHQWRGYWSRRINSEHRLVYCVEGSKKSERIITVIQCRYHT